MRKQTVLLLVLVLLASTATMFLPIKANPYLYHKNVSAPSYVKLPNIIIACPSENSLYPNGTVTVCFNVTGPDAPNLLTKYISMVDYKGDWMEGAKYAYRTKNYEVYTPDDFPFSLEFNFTIHGVPCGKHTLVITAVGGGGYAENDLGLTWYQFGINGSSSVNFTIGTIPIVSFLSFENRIFETPNVPLNFTVDHAVSQIFYCLDEKENRAIDGNTTITGLSNGYHNVTVYAIDELGNTGISETVSFTIASKNNTQEPYTIAPVAAVLGILGIASCSGIFLYLRKKKHSAL